MTILYTQNTFNNMVRPIFNFVILSAFVLMGTPSLVFGQLPCNPAPPPSSELCEDAPILCNIGDLNNYCTAMSQNITGNGPSPLCNGGGAPHNVIWFAFYAGCTELNMTLTPENCIPVGGQIGIQAAIFGYGGDGLCPSSNQQPDETIWCQSTPCFDNQVTIQANGLQIGQIYYFMIDGCAGSYCDIHISVNSPCGPPAIGPWPGPITGPDPICTGATGNYCVTAPVGAVEYYWYLDGSEIQAGPDNCIDITWFAAGTYELCVDVSNQCIFEGDNPAPLCTTIEVYDVTPEDPQPVTICEGTTYPYPGDGLDYPPGIYTVSLTTPQDCDSVITLTVLQDDIEETDLGFIYLCPEDIIDIAGVQYDYSQQGQQEVTISQEEFPFCDSVIQFEILGIYLETYIFPPEELGCIFQQVQLDGGGSLFGPVPGTIGTFQWEAYDGGVLGSPSDQPLMTVDVPGKYCLRLEVVAENGSTSCWDSMCVVVIQNEIPDVSATQDGPITCFNPVVNLVGASMTPNTLGEWRDENFQLVGQGFTATTTVPGIFTFIVTDATGCTAETSVFVEAFIDPPQVSATGDLITCLNDPGTLVGSSNTPGTTYAWKDNTGNTIGTMGTMPAPGPGNYTFVVTNPVNGCSDSVTVVVDINQVLPDIAASTDTLTCNLTNPPLNGNSIVPNATYAWSGPGGFNATVKDTSTTLAGSYTLTVTNPLNGCVKDTTIVVPENTAQPDAQATGDFLDCVKTTATLTGSSATPGATYLWLDPMMNPLGSNSTQDVTMPGIYSLVVTGLNGCTRIVTAEATLDADIPDITISAPFDTINCNIQDILLTGFSSANVQYLWTDAGGNTLSNVATYTATSAGTYTLTVTADNGCTNTMDYTIEEDLAVPDITSTTGGIKDCVIPCVQLNVVSSTPGVTYQWTSPGGVQLAPGPDPCVVNPGTYTVVVTGYNGCTSSATALVESSPDLPQNVTTSVSGIINCTNPSVTITVSSTTPTVSFQWSGPNGFSSTNASELVSKEGAYSVTVTNTANGCTALADIGVQLDTIHPVLTPNGGLIDCYNPSISISVTSNPNSGVVYSWTDPNAMPIGGNNPTITTSISGSHSVTVLNTTNGCETTTPVVVTEDTAQPAFLSISATEINCITTSATINAPTNVTVDYLWSGPGIDASNETDASPVVTVAGTYNVIVTNPINGCTNTNTVDVLENVDNPIISMSGFTIDCTTPAQDLVATITPNSNVTINWTLNGAPYTGTTPTINVNEPGIYEITVVNNINGCSASEEVTVIGDFDQPDIEATGSELSCTELFGPISATSATTGVTWAWSGPNGFTSTQANNSVNIAGSYLVVASAPNGCTNQATVIVTEDKDLPTAVASNSNIIDCTNETTTLSANGSSTGTAFTYAWSDPNGNFIGSANTLPGISLVGTYTLLVTNTTNGCFNTATTTVIDNQNLPTGIDVEITNARCFNNKDGNIIVTAVTGGTPDYLYSINGGPFTTNPQFAGLGAGIYSITIQDAAGCLFTQPDLEITEPELLTVELGEDFIMQWGRDTFLYALISPPNAIIESIIWTPAGVDTTLNSNEINIKPFNQTLYGVQVTDANGCRAEDKVLVLVEKRRPVYIPNVFNPSGEQNTRFYIQAGEGIEEVEVFEVFNRWGERVFKRENFQPNDPSLGWDGTFRSRPVDPEVLVYYAKIRFNDGITLLYKGDVTLVR
jgi:hypothetical protein